VIDNNQGIGACGRRFQFLSRRIEISGAFAFEKRDEAFLIAVNIAKLPSVPRQILKEIPRPPNLASRDD